MKICTGCNSEKPKSEFHKSKNKPDGLNSRCKSCAKKYYQKNRDKIIARSIENQKNNKEQRVEYMAEYYQNNKEKFFEYHTIRYQKNKKQILEYSHEYQKKNKEKIDTWRTEYREKNKDKIAATVARYRENNKSKVAEMQAEWKRANPDRVKEYNRKSRLKRRGVEKGIAYTSLEIFERDGWICQLCEEPVIEKDSMSKWGPTIDHIIPVTKDGIDCETNVQLAHRSCNSSKGNRIQELIC